MAYQRSVKKELKTAKLKQLPIFIMFATDLTKNERIELEDHFMGCNIFKTVDADIDVSISEGYIQAQVTRIFKEYMDEAEPEYDGDLNSWLLSQTGKDLFIIIANRSYLKKMRN